MAYCDRCARYFPHNRALQQHLENSSFHWICDDCGLDYPNKESRRNHYIQSKNHHYCGVHDQHFQNQNNLQQHLNSRHHQLSNVKCPGYGCNRSFISPAALILHFESGTCSSGLTRAELDRRVVRADRNHLITNPDRLICGPGGCEPPTTTWQATEYSWNGMEYECYLCHKGFGTLNRLNQHLQSPFHKEKIYRCPKSDCRIEFKTLSALFQHVEGGSCGVQRFRQVRDAMDRLTRSVNALTL